MNVLRLACLILSLAAVFPSETLGKGSDNSGSSSGSRSGSSQKRAKLDRALSNPSKLSARTRVIIRHRPDQSDNVRQRVTKGGGRFLKVHRTPGLVTAELSPKALAELVDDSHVHGISLDAPVSGSQLWSNTTSTLTSTTSSLLSSVDTQALRRTLGVEWTQYGSDVGVAIIDSGIAPTADVAKRISAFYDFTKAGTPAATTPSDGYGHGTHIAGLIAGNGYMSRGKHVGVALGARLIGLKVLDNEGKGYTSDVIAALEFATANKATLRIDVINLSLGHQILEPAATDPLVQAVEKAVAAGIVVVVSAGNNGMNPTTGEIGYAGINSPGNAPSALTVGSLRTKATTSRYDDEVSPFSSRGPTLYDGLIKPDILAPGQALIATQGLTSVLYNNLLLQSDLGYAKLSGTSMAAGVASGVVALMIEANRKDEGPYSVLTPNMIKAILQYTAIPVADPDPSTGAALEQGAGGMNAAGAIALTRAIEPTTAEGSWWLEQSLSPFTAIGGATLAWANHIVWGDHIVTGDTLKFSLKAWAMHIVWGDHILWGDHIVWGDGFFSDENEVKKSFLSWKNHIVWGDTLEHIVWGDNDEHIVWGDLDLEHIVWGDSTSVFGLSSGLVGDDPLLLEESTEEVPAAELESFY
jgi:serine protease AprX